MCVKYMTQSSGDHFISRSSSQIQYQHVHSRAQFDHEDQELTSNIPWRRW